MTENEAIYCLKAGSERHSEVCEECSLYGKVGCDHCYDDATDKAIQALDKVQQFEAIGTIEEFKALKEKNTPMELDEHNFQDEVHHYLCPRCRNVVNCNQNYCEECGQALET